MSILKRFLTSEDGVTSIEYALIASLIAVFSLRRFSSSALS